MDTQNTKKRPMTSTERVRRHRLKKRLQNEELFLDQQRAKRQFYRERQRVQEDELKTKKKTALQQYMQEKELTMQLGGKSVHSTLRSVLSADADTTKKDVRKEAKAYLDLVDITSLHRRLFRAMQAAGRPVTMQSVNAYMDRIQMAYNMLHPRQRMPDLEFLKDAKKVISTVEASVYSTATKDAIVAAIHSVLSIMHGWDAYQEPYTKRMLSRSQTRRESDTFLQTVIDALYAEKDRRKASTIQSYVTNLKRVFALVYPDSPGMTSLDWLKKTRTVTQTIDATFASVSTRATIYAALTSILASMTDGDNAWKTAKTKYGNLMRMYQRKRDTALGDNQLSDREKDTFLKWQDILDSIREYDSENGSSEDRYAMQRVIIDLYTLFPPRRLQDYRLMRLCTSASSVQKMQKAFNYLVVDSDSDRVEFVFNVYKTVKKYKQQRFLLNREHPALADVLTTYVRQHRIRHGDLLFATTAHRPFENFGFQLKSATNRVVGKSLSCNAFRHAFVSHFVYGDNKSTFKTYNQREAVSKKMGHSVSMQVRYVKIGLI